MTSTNTIETSDRIAHPAAVILRKAGVSHQIRLDGSALAQHHTAKQTSAAMGSLAGESAGSVLSQVRHLHGTSAAH